MKIISYRHLRDFEWWGPAKENVRQLTYDQMDILDDYFEDVYPDGIYEMELNDAFAYYFDDIKDILAGK